VFGQSLTDGFMEKQTAFSTFVGTTAAGIVTGMAAKSLHTGVVATIIYGVGMQTFDLAEDSPYATENRKKWIPATKAA